MSSRGDRTDPRVARTRDDVPRAAYRILVDEGADAVTHTRVAEAAGYAKATLYTHWPTRTDLLHAALSLMTEVDHASVSGDPRADLIGQMSGFRSMMEDRGTHRALGAMAELSAAGSPELAELRDRVAAEGERVMRGVLADVTDGPELEAAALMLNGAVLYAAMLHGGPPDDDTIATIVDVVLRGLRASRDG
ncbi:TetR/AcrR family transcriptional regulator [Pseudonocardia endophytica]|uniref:TetR family transcriptional regulator n=1 Tax=Pseudonocardia endophytica TaxID=401976 RepID=A0A4V2PIQ2_PSEEN|nr:TetR/AcrR family transcriptional regulator [Pseudonocardia endophytica]TCK25606.1 TetR family transcriptional regulator [Pseudonocardia endophytica]